MKCRYVGGDIKKYLDDCFIRYDGVPYYASVSDDRVHLVDLETRTTTSIVRGDDPLLDISSIPLGWVNANSDYALHLKRLPYRKWKQGVSTSNTEMATLTENGISRDRMGKNSLLNKEFKSSILGTYPDFGTALKLLTVKGRISVALSKDVAMVRDRSNIKVYFGEEVLGLIDLSKDKKVLQIKKTEYSWVSVLEISKISGLEVLEV